MESLKERGRGGEREVGGRVRETETKAKRGMRGREKKEEGKGMDWGGRVR